jgi:hypothetical protein
MSVVRVLTLIALASSFSCAMTPEEQALVEVEPEFEGEAARNRLAPISLAIEGGGSLARANVYWDRQLKTACEFRVTSGGIRCLPVHPVIGDVVGTFVPKDASSREGAHFADATCTRPAVRSWRPPAVDEVAARSELGVLRFVHDTNDLFYAFDGAAAAVPVYVFRSRQDPDDGTYRGECKKTEEMGWPVGRPVPVTQFAKLARVVTPA